MLPVNPAQTRAAAPDTAPLHEQLAAPPQELPDTTKAVPLRLTFAKPAMASVPAFSCATVTAVRLHAEGDA